ncbi:MAG: nucleotidyltransferase domain-containing protein [Candidatus Woesearchaeota archaeon]
MGEPLKQLFFSQSMRRWHFEDIVNESKLSRERVNHYLKGLLAEKIIVRLKPKGRMPYYEANRDSSKFRFEKRLYGLKILEESGLFEHINSLKEVKTAILFGSFARGDWNVSSDVDIFIYGDSKHFDKGKLESKIKKEIQVFSYDNAKSLKKELDKSLIPNIVQGFNIKGTFEPFEVKISG